MPIYEYSCGKCRARVEVMQKITDKPLKRCQSCGGKLEKEWSTSSFQLKGSGWYMTDYAVKKAGAPDTESAAKSEDATENKTESKTESKTEGADGAKSAKETKAEVAGTEETTVKKTSQPAATSKPTKSD